MMQRVRPLQASATRIKHSMEDGPSFPRCRKVLLYSYRVDVTLSLEWLFFFLREILAGRRAIETGAFSARWFTRRRALLLLFAHIFCFFFFFTVFIFGCWMVGGSFTIILLFFSVYASYFGFCYVHCAGHYCWDMAHSLLYQ